MVAPETDPNAEGLRAVHRGAVEVVVIVQQEKGAVILGVAAVFQVGGGDAEAHLAQKYHRLRLHGGKAAGGQLQVAVIFGGEGGIHPEQAAGRGRDQLDLPQGSGLDLTELAEPGIDLVLNAGQLPLLFRHGGLLGLELFLDLIHVPIPEKVGDLRQGHVQGPEIADGVEGFKLPDAVIAVAGVRIDALRRYQPQGLVVADAADAEVKQPGHFTDLKELHGPSFPHAAGRRRRSGRPEWRTGNRRR